MSSAKAAIVNYVNLTSDRQIEGGALMLQKFMKGIFTLKPALPKYGVTWDASRVLVFLKTQSPPEALSLLALSKKLAMLLLLLTGHRGQSIHSLENKGIECSESALIISFSKVLKTSKPGNHCGEIVIPAYETDKRLCVVCTYKAYIKRTLKLRKKSGKLFIATIKPFDPISRDTFGRWIRETMARAGIDLARFGSHSTRGAATSMALAKGVPVATIIKTAGWKYSDTFRKFYNRPITRDGGFAQALLDASAQDE